MTDDKTLDAVGEYIREHCNPDCQYWRVNQRYPTYDAGCSLDIMDEQGNPSCITHSLSDCPLIEELLEL